MDNNDKDSQQESPEENKTGKASQIPLIHDIIFDERAPLKAPPRPSSNSSSNSSLRAGRVKKPAHSDHGPDYDPDTLDLFEEPSSKLLSYANDHTEEELRTGGDQLIDDLVEEYSVQIAQQLRDELNDQLHSILEDLDDSEHGS